MNNYKNLNVTELRELLATQHRINLIDVRTEAECALGTIKNALPLPLHLLPMRLSELDPTVTTVFYCQMGGRSAQAAAFAANQGMQDVYNLQGGITAWAQTGGEIVR